MTKPWMVMLLVCSLPALSLAQVETSEPLVPLRIEIGVNQGQGPPATHTMHVTANRLRPTELRQGQEVAVPTDTSYQYRNVGTNINCRATSQGDKFLVSFVFEQSAIADSSGTPPSFHTFNITHELLLADGQSVELATAANETWKVELKLDVVK